MREVYWLAQEKNRIKWNHTCALIAEIRNLFAKRPVSAAEIHPMREQ